MTDVEAIQSRLDATEGPWELCTTSTLYMNGQAAYTIRMGGKPGIRMSMVALPQDAEFIGHAREDVATLLDEVKQLRATADEAITLLEKIGAFGLHDSHRPDMRNEAMRLRKALRRAANDAFTEEQVAQLNKHQAEGSFHPHTCPNRGDGEHRTTRDLGVLVATTAGWICPDCDYTQDWAVPLPEDARRSREE